MLRSLPLPSAQLAEDMDAAASGDRATTEELELSKASKALAFAPSVLRERCEGLVAPLRREPPVPLAVLVAVEALAAVIVEPGSRTTDTRTLNMLLQVRRVGSALGRTRGGRL